MNEIRKHPLMNSVGNALGARRLPTAWLIRGAQRSAQRRARALMNESCYSLMFDWFAGLTAWGTVWENPVCPDERAQLMQHEVSEAFL